MARLTSNPPHRTSHPPADARVSLTVGPREICLENERALIGRGPHCRVVIDDPLVSREHALLRISGQSVVIEDLKSANGTFVNNRRISELCPLSDGDQVLVGTQEIRVSQVYATGHAGPESADFCRETPSASDPFGRTTERADALVLLGRVAARKLSEGSPREAEEALSAQLQRVLTSARSGAAVSRTTCVAASKHALLLATALGSAHWIDYVIELHYFAGHPVDEQTVGLLEEALKHTGGADRELYVRYVETMRRRWSELDEASRLAFERLSALELDI